MINAEIAHGMRERSRGKGQEPAKNKCADTQQAHSSLVSWPHWVVHPCSSEFFSQWAPARDRTEERETKRGANTPALRFRHRQHLQSCLRDRTAWHPGCQDGAR